MAEWNVGKKNGMWRGGRSIASNGYVLIRVGKEHRRVPRRLARAPVPRGEIVSDKHDLNDARQAHFALGGIESDIGPRDGASWYWRRAVELAVHRAELAERLCVKLGDRLELLSDTSDLRISDISDLRERVDRYRRRIYNPEERRLMEPFSYQDKATPDGYRCHQCGATQRKLWRDIRVVATAIKLSCGSCALSQEKVTGPIDNRGRVKTFDFTNRDGELSDQIGGLLPAVPTEDGRTFWGYTSVPADACAWWRGLPL